MPWTTVATFELLGENAGITYSTEHAIQYTNGQTEAVEPLAPHANSSGFTMNGTNSLPTSVPGHANSSGFTESIPAQPNRISDLSLLLYIFLMVVVTVMCFINVPKMLSRMSSKPSSAVTPSSQNSSVKHKPRSAREKAGLEV